MEAKMNLDKNPAGRLVTEHRLLERYLLLMEKQAELMDRGKNPDRVFIERLIDFFKTYAHRCHYGKEEEILFQRLYVKDLLPEHKIVIDGLVLEHIRERGLMDRLEIAKDKFWLGESRAFMDILGNLKDILNFYPAHMQREEKELFFPSMEYFSEEEQMDMLREFAEFDQNLIHEKYIRMADQYEGFLAPSEYGGRTIQDILQPEVAPLSDRKPEGKE
jgi:hemerythrin-like domain-containing protein